MKRLLVLTLLFALPLAALYTYNAAEVDLKGDWFAGGAGGDEPAGPWP